MEYMYNGIDYANQEEGSLNLEDGIDCPICKNKGFIVYLDKGKYEKVRDCECMPRRRTMKRLLRTGISKETLEQLTFKNFTINDKWQETIRDILVNYCKNFKDNNNSWVYLSGISGSGKTHLCTATFQYLVKQGYEGEYLLWNEFLPRMIAMERSVIADVQQEYQLLLERLQNIDVLYIDDFLKLTNQEDINRSLSIAYRILNSRYINNKITIISSEIDNNELKKLDLAIFSRIYEKCGNGKYVISTGKDTIRNYRTR